MKWSASSESLSTSISLLFENMEDLQKGLATHAAEILADVPNFTNVQPQIQIGSVVLGVGTAVPGV